MRDSQTLEHSNHPKFGTSETEDHLARASGCDDLVRELGGGRITDGLGVLDEERKGEHVREQTRQRGAGRRMSCEQEPNVTCC